MSMDFANDMVGMDDSQPSFLSINTDTGSQGICYGYDGAYVCDTDADAGLGVGAGADAGLGAGAGVGAGGEIHAGTDGNVDAHAGARNLNAVIPAASHNDSEPAAKKVKVIESTDVRIGRTEDTGRSGVVTTGTVSANGTVGGDYNDNDNEYVNEPYLTIAQSKAKVNAETVRGGTDASQTSAPTMSAAAAAATTTASTTASTTAAVKKRPYIRTKRPAGYNDKSSITTTTDALWRSPLNVYDAVLQESKDLLQAATEAQQLGRLKMASAYLLLLHARLVGLGKRFDKAPPPLKRVPVKHPATNSQGQTTTSHNTTAADAAHDTRLSHYPTPQLQEQQLQQQQQQQQSTTRPPAVNDTSAAALVQFLPSNIELDTAMMEHLARAAAELHAARCSGRHNNLLSTTTPPLNELLNAAVTSTPNPHATILAGTEPLNPEVATATSPSGGWNFSSNGPALTHSGATGAPTPTCAIRPPYKRSLLQSPNVGEFLASTANQRGVTNAATVTGVAQVRRLVAAPASREVGPSAAAVAAASSYTSRTFGTQWDPHPATAAATTTHTASSTTHQPSPASTKYSMTGRPLDVMTTETETTLLTPSETAGATATTPSSVANTSGVRCKPVTTAMNTVPHANCDARSLLQGAPFWQSDKTTPDTGQHVRTQTRERIKQEDV